MSAYKLMEPRDIIEVGFETNPFFKFYENNAREYPVRRSDGTTENIASMRFLQNVLQGNINPDNLPQTAYEISNHFLMLSRELVWENIRIEKYPNYPSRQKCLWLLKNQDQIERWKKILKLEPRSYSIVKVKATGRAIEVDSSHLPSDSEPLPTWYEKAYKYWEGAVTEDPLKEFLFVGKIKVTEVTHA